MKDTSLNQDEIQRRRLQEYIFGLEDKQEEAEALAVEHQRLQQVQNFLNAILDATTNGICLVKDYEIAWCNQGLSAILGWEQDELIGKSLAVLCADAASYAKMKQLVECNRSKAAVERFESDFIHKSGVCVPCLVTQSTLDNRDAAKGCIFSFTDISDYKRAEKALKAAHDELEDRVAKRTEELNKINTQLERELTERKRIEEALLQSEKKYRTVLEGTPDPVVVYDMKGKVMYLNPAFTKIFGWTLDERLGQTMDQFVPEKARSETDMMIAKTLAGETFSFVETLRYTKDGHILPVSVSGAVFRNRAGVPLGSVINLRDISQAKKLEAQLRRAHKMEAIGTLASCVAHDLNNILFAVVSYPDLLLMRIPDDSPLRKSILAIKASGEKAAEIVKDLLTLSRQGVDKAEVVCLNTVVSDYLQSPEFNNLKLHHPEVEIETDFESDLVNISGSCVHLFKTIMNLVTNAAEALPNGGIISITTANRYLDKPISGYKNIVQGNYAKLTVADEGTGISKDDIKNIFKPFYTKKQMGKSGTGLGMSIVWGCVKDHEGYIDVQSADSTGAKFTLFFPATVEDIDTQRPYITIKEIMGNGESVLVVDDVRDQREIASTLLTTLGYIAKSVSSGEEAVEYLQAHTTDMVILDMIMPPGLDGLDTFKKIVEIHPDQKVIITSGFAKTERVMEAQKLGVVRFIKKPYTLEKIGLALKEEFKARFQV